MELTYLGNCGLLLAEGETRLLVDGIWQDGSGFSDMDEEQVRAAAQASGLMAGISAAAFTHPHADHFDAARTARWLRHSPGVQLFLPVDARYPHREIEENRPYFSPPPRFITAGHEEGQAGSWKLLFDHVRHLGDGSIDCRCYCLTVEAGGLSILITADADYADPGFAAKLYRRHYDAVLVNSLPLSTAAGRELLTGFDAKQVLIYHLPLAADDKYNYRAVAMQNLARHSGELSNCRILARRGEVIRL